MKDILKEITPKRMAYGMGVICFFICIVMLYFRPQESWYDDAFWADWAYRLSQGNFITYVWGGGQPSYSPLYALFLSVWYRIVGFSYFSAQFPNYCFALIAYLVICRRFNDGNLFLSKSIIFGFSICYWFANELFWIFSCGRVDTLCFLLGILSIDAYLRAFETNRKINYFLFCLWSFMEMATGFEGVVFTFIFICIHAVLNYKLIFKKWYLYGLYVLSSFFSFTAVIAYMAWYNCAKAYLRTMFGFSYTMQSIIHFIETGDLSFENIIPIDDSMTLLQKLQNLTVDGILYNKEYLIMEAILIVLTFIMIVNHKWKELSVLSKICIFASILTPFVFALLGRYASYYTWTSYVFCCIAFFDLLQHSRIKEIGAWISVICIIMWFTLTPAHREFKRIDFCRAVDKQNIKDIQAANIDYTESIYIPYQWYYYLAPITDKIYFSGSGYYPKDMTKMVFSTSQERDHWVKTLDLEYLYNIGTKEVWGVRGDRGQNILR